MIAARYPVFALCVSLLAGCASAKLEITTDIYEEDLRYLRPATVDEIVTLRKRLKQAEDFAETSKLSLGQTVDPLINLNETLQELDDCLRLDEAECGADPVTLETQRKSANEEIASITKDLLDVVSQGEARLDRGVLLRQDVLVIDQRLTATTELFKEAATQFLRTRSAEAQKLASVVRDLGNELFASETENDDPNKLPLNKLQQLASKAVTNYESFVKEVADQAKRVGTELPMQEKIFADIKSKRVQIQTDLSSIETSLNDDDKRAALLRVTRRIGQLPEASLPQVQMGLRQQIAVKAEGTLREQVQEIELLNSQIDRLQDAGDPALRQLVKEENEKKWLRVFSHTEFYAEGNTNVVIVRERPGHYSIKKGVNNPTALIRSQLNISRTIVSGALEVIGSLTGVPLPPGLQGVPKAVDEKGDPVETLGQSAEAQEAKFDAEVLRRKIVRDRLLLELDRLIQEASGATMPASLVPEAIAFLEAQKRLLEERTYSSEAVLGTTAVEGDPTRPPENAAAAPSVQ